MGFWKGLGKVLLKAAPIAAAFIPGVGPLASMAIGAGTGALSKKIEGGSLKDSLIAGGIGAATGYGGAQAAKGLGPSAGIMSKIKSGAGTLVGGNQGTGNLGNALNVASSVMRALPSNSGNSNPQGGGIGPSRIPPMNQSNAIQSPQIDMRSPNLLASITRGRRMVNPSYEPSY
jgi:hypothetical protein